MKHIILAGPGSEAFGKKLSRHLQGSYATPVVKHFPDGELKMQIPVDVHQKHVVLVYSFQPNPDEVLLECLFAMGACRQLGAKKVTIVAPYMGFLRQDKMFHPGEAKSNSIVAALLSSADKLITMDPHLHRIKSLNEIFKTKTKKLTANDLIAAHLRKKHKNAIVMGPDGESSQWASAVAKKAGVQSIILKKKRYTATKVRILIKSKIPLKGKNVVLVDDIISTGHTMIEPIKQLKKMGVKSITCMGVHAVFADNALKTLRKLGAKVECTNTIKNPVEKIDVSKAFADVV